MLRFHLVDFAAHYQKGFRNHVVSIAEVPKLVEAFGRYGCYATCFFYSDEVLTYMSARSQGSAPTIAGYQGAAKACVTLTTRCSQPTLKRPARKFQRNAKRGGGRLWRHVHGKL